jgi:hypothetical protein
VKKILKIAFFFVTLLTAMQMEAQPLTNETGYDCYDEVYAGGETIISGGTRYNGSKYARVEWNFKTRKLKVSGTNFTTVTKDFYQKWRAGVGVRLTHYGTNESSGWYVYHNGSYVPSYNVYAQAYVSASAGN